jgi:CheY-like chemotaxis protein
MANIMLADDSAALLATMGQILRLEGHEVTSTNSGADALCLLSRYPPHDLVILDWKMPGMSGVEAIQRMKNDSPPVILMTGSDEPLPTFDTAKVKRVLRKPFGWGKLVGMVDECLGVENPRKCACEDEDDDGVL